MAVNRSIQDILSSIRNAIFGKDVRAAIADGIEKCYYYVDTTEVKSILFDIDTPVIYWRQGYYDLTNGSFVATPRYRCTQFLYDKKYLDYLKGFDYTAPNHYFVLFNAGSFYRVVSRGGTFPETGWDKFGIVIYVESYTQDIDQIRFATFQAVEGIVNRAVADAPSEIEWQQGYYDTSTGAYNSTSTSYRCSKQHFKRDLLKYLEGWDFQTGYNFVSLYNGSTYVRLVNSGSTSGIFSDDWDNFTLSVSLTYTPVSIQSIRFLSLENTHVALKATTAQELIDAVNVAIKNEGKGRYYDIYLNPGTYELWPVLDKTAIYGSGDQIYHRGLELPDKCNLYGVGGTRSVIISCTIPESDNSSEHPYTTIVSTLNLHNTNNTLENIVFVGNNTRYCIHDDSGFDEQNKQLIVRRCRFEHNGTLSETYMPSPRCYGAGYTTGRKGLFENCIFQSSGNCNHQLYVHTHSSQYNKSDCETVVKNCAFITANKTAIDYQVTYNNVPGGIVTIDNCYFASGSIVRFRGSSSEVISSPGTIVYGGGNSSFTLDNQISATSYLV